MTTCKTCGHELQESELLEIEGLTITKPLVATTYEEAKKLCVTEFRLPTRWELFKIFEKMENRKKLSDGGYMFFWSSLVENNCVRGLYLYRNLDVDSDDDDLAYSNDDGRCIFIKESPK